jgi:hypothetical protein
MTAEKSKRKFLRQQAAGAGIFSIAELARQAGCSRQAVYFALEKPTRFKPVRRRIESLIGPIS